MIVTVDHMDESRANLRTADGQRITIPADELPAGTAEGNTLTFSLTRDADVRAQHAKELLNELLGGTS